MATTVYEREIGVASTHAFIHLAQVVKKVENAIHRINLYPLDSTIGFPNSCPLDSDLSDG